MEETAGRDPHKAGSPSKTSVPRRAQSAPPPSPPTPRRSALAFPEMLAPQRCCLCQLVPA